MSAINRMTTKGIGREQKKNNNNKSKSVITRASVWVGKWKEIAPKRFPRHRTFRTAYTSDHFQDRFASKKWEARQMFWSVFRDAQTGVEKKVSVFNSTDRILPNAKDVSIVIVIFFRPMFVFSIYRRFWTMSKSRVLSPNDERKFVTKRVSV